MVLRISSCKVEGQLLEGTCVYAAYPLLLHNLCLIWHCYRSTAVHQIAQINADSPQPPLQHVLQQGYSRNIPKQQQSSPSRLGPGPLPSNHVAHFNQRSQHYAFGLPIPGLPDSQQVVGEGGRSVSMLPQSSWKESWVGSHNPTQGAHGSGTSIQGGPGFWTGQQGNTIVSPPSLPAVNGFQEASMLQPQDQPATNSPPWGRKIFS